MFSKVGKKSVMLTDVIAERKSGIYRNIARHEAGFS